MATNDNSRDATNTSSSSLITAWEFLKNIVGSSWVYLVFGAVVLVVVLAVIWVIIKRRQMLRCFRGKPPLEPLNYESKNEKVNTVEETMPPYPDIPGNQLPDPIPEVLLDGITGGSFLVGTSPEESTENITPGPTTKTDEVPPERTEAPLDQAPTSFPSSASAVGSLKCVDVTTLTQQIKEEILKDLRLELRRSLTPSWVKAEVDWSDDEVELRPRRRSSAHKFTVLSQPPRRRHTVSNKPTTRLTREPVYENPGVTKPAKRRATMSKLERQIFTPQSPSHETQLYENTSSSALPNDNNLSLDKRNKAPRDGHGDNMPTQVMPYRLTKKRNCDMIYENNVAVRIAQTSQAPSKPHLLSEDQILTLFSKLSEAAEAKDVTMSDSNRSSDVDSTVSTASVAEGSQISLHFEGSIRAKSSDDDEFMNL